MPNKKLKELLHELKHHTPFAAMATIVAILIVLLTQYILNVTIEETLFESFHALHIVASSIVTAGIFYKYKKSISKALLVGIFGSILIGSLSDIIFPWLGGNLLGLETHFHLPLIEFPTLILGVSFLGSLMGIYYKNSMKTKFSHFAHVFLSVFASLFYLLAFSTTFNIVFFIAAFAIVFISVILPCCISDIIFPFFFLGKNIKHCNC